VGVIHDVGLDLNGITVNVGTGREALQKYFVVLCCVAVCVVLLCVLCSCVLCLRVLVLLP